MNLRIPELSHWIVLGYLHMLPDLLPIRLRHALGHLCDKLDCYRESALSDVQFALYALWRLLHIYAWSIPGVDASMLQLKI
jgi:hypothetical protein